MIPSGKPEQVQTSIGLFFAEKPPTRHPIMIALTTRVIDIAAGDPNYVVKQEFVLPTDVDVLAVQPHAHLICTQMKGFATLPDGQRKWLIYIKRWDFNWQDGYRYAKPVFLPKGTTLSMEYSYDNSARNVRNPSQPPIRVTGGWKTFQEMAELWLQVLPKDASQRGLLFEAIEKKRLEMSIEYFEHQLQGDPRDAGAHHRLGMLLVGAGRVKDAFSHYQQAIEIQPDLADAHFSIGVLSAQLGRWPEASRAFQQVIDIQPEHAAAHRNLGRTYQRQGDRRRAQQQYEEALRIQPEFADARSSLANLLGKQNDWPAAAVHLEKILQAKPDSAEANYNLGLALAKQKKWQQSIPYFEAAVRIRPEMKSAGKYLERAREEVQGKE